VVCDGGCVRGACATREDGEDVDLGSLPLAAEGVSNKSVFFTDKSRGVK
jgi:hypothetical protein